MPAAAGDLRRDRCRGEGGVTAPQLLATIEQNGGQALFTDPGAFAEHVRNEAQELDRLLKKYPPPRE